VSIEAWREPCNTDAEFVAEPTQRYVTVLRELLPRPPFVLAQATGDCSRYDDDGRQQGPHNIRDCESAVDIHRFVEAVPAQNGEAAGGSEDAGQLHYSFVGQRSVAAKDDVRRVVTAEELPCLGRHRARTRQLRVQSVVLVESFGERLRRVLAFERVHAFLWRPYIVTALPGEGATTAASAADCIGFCWRMVAAPGALRRVCASGSKVRGSCWFHSRFTRTHAITICGPSGAAALSEAERDRRIVALRARLFDATEPLRVEAIERFSDQP